MLQLYFDDPRLHYEVWNLGSRGPFPGGSMEVGLHFESKDKALNQRLLQANIRHMIELKVTLGESWIAEDWDKGWTKVYTLIPKPKFSEADLNNVSAQLAEAIVFLEPIRREVD